mmetsp:Transcript_18612/g.60539  ORF Transcript_18612/g.60539 Transcript_18612/m.60539 type:complete len:217 (+) Transcript_18612:2390-3040(+)
MEAPAEQTDAGDGPSGRQARLQHILDDPLDISRGHLERRIDFGQRLAMRHKFLQVRGRRLVSEESDGLPEQKRRAVHVYYQEFFCARLVRIISQMILLRNSQKPYTCSYSSDVQASLQTGIVTSSVQHQRAALSPSQLLQLTSCFLKGEGISSPESFSKSSSEGYSVDHVDVLNAGPSQYQKAAEADRSRTVYGNNIGELGLDQADGMECNSDRLQ